MPGGQSGKVRISPGSTRRWTPQNKKLPEQPPDAVYRHCSFLLGEADLSLSSLRALSGIAIGFDCGRELGSCSFN